MVWSHTAYSLQKDGLRPMLAAVIIVVSGLGLAGCAGSTADVLGQAQLEPPPQIEDFASLQSLPKVVADTDDGLLQDGSSFVDTYFHQNVAADGTFARYSPAFDIAGPGPAELAAAIYQFTIDEVLEDQAVYFSWREAPATADVWIGLSDWSSDSWVLCPVGADWRCHVGALSAYLDGEDRLLVLLIAAGVDECLLEWVRVGGIKHYWVQETIDEGPNWCGMYPGLALDSNDLPHFSYRFYIDTLLQDQVRYKRRLLEGGWETMVVTDAVGSGDYTSLALDSEEVPHLCWLNSVTNSVYYAIYDGADWDETEVFTSEGSVSNASLALDSSDMAHIAFLHSDDNTVRYSYEDMPEWHTVTAATDARSLSNITLDSLDRPHVTYQRLSDHFLVYTHRVGLLWVEEDVTDFTTFLLLAMDLDTADNPHIIFSNTGGDEHFIYSWYDGSEWGQQQLREAEGLFTCCSIIVAADGSPFISLVDDEVGMDCALFCSYNTGAEWQENQLGEPAWHNVIKLDSRGRPHIAAHRPTPAGGRLNYFWMAEEPY